MEIIVPSYSSYQVDVWVLMEQSKVSATLRYSLPQTQCLLMKWRIPSELHDAEYHNIVLISLLKHSQIFGFGERRKFSHMLELFAERTFLSTEFISWGLH